MPVIKSAIKKLRQDKKREKQNDKVRDLMRSSVRSAKKTKTGKAVTKAISTVDKAAKLNIIHKNKASRLKSSLSKLAKPASSKTIKSVITSKAKADPKTTAPKKAVKTTVKKAPSAKKKTSK